MDELKKKSAFSELLIGVLTIPVIVLVQGWSIHCLWNWFLPAISIAPRIGTAEGVGLFLLIAYIRPITSAKDELTVGERLLASIVICLVALGVGFVAHLLMIVRLAV